MKMILHHSTARIWFLVGLTGTVLSAVFLFEHGYARTLTTPPQIHSTIIQDTQASGSATKTGKLEKSPGSPSTNLPHHPEKVVPEVDNEEKPNKKRFGLAILFLGVLAEKS